MSQHHPKECLLPGTLSYLPRMPARAGTNSVRLTPAKRDRITAISMSTTSFACHHARVAQASANNPRREHVTVYRGHAGAPSEGRLGTGRSEVVGVERLDELFEHRPLGLVDADGRLLWCPRHQADLVQHRLSDIDRNPSSQGDRDGV